MNRGKLWTIIGVVVVLVTVVLATGLARRIPKADFQALQTENAVLVETKANLTEHLEEVQSDLTDTQAEYETLQTDYTGLVEERDNLTEQLNRAQSDLTELNADYTTLMEEKNSLTGQLEGMQSDLANAQAEFRALQVEYDRVNAQFRDSEAQVTELQSEIRELKERYEIVGETPTETVENIVERYHETHIYSEYDFFVCSDMALDVWDMLKAQGIDALIQIGNVQTRAEDITKANHAWVLAEVSPGYYLALETTGGYAVWRTDNPLYYEGWPFDNPREYKRFVELRYEYNIRVNLIEQLAQTFEVIRRAGLEAANEYNEISNEVNEMSVFDPLLSSKVTEAVLKAEECGEHIGRCDQLTELINEQTQELGNIVSEMRGLTN